MPDRTVYTITEKGEKEFRDTLRKSILQFDYDTNVFSIAAFFIDVFNKQEKVELLEKRLEILQKYLDGIKKQITFKWKNEVMPTHTANVERITSMFSSELFPRKLIRQIWEMGIRDKKLLCIIKQMLKAPVVLPDAL